MNIKYCNIIMLLFCFIGSENTYTQIYCPGEETFNGPVSSVKEIQYKLNERILYGLNRDNNDDTIKFASKALIQVKNGRILEKRILDANDSLYCLCTRIYSSDGHLVENTTFNFKGKVDTRIVNTWENDLLIRIDRYNVKDSLYSSTVHLRDKHQKTEISKELVSNEEENIIFTELNEFDQPLKCYSVDEFGSKKLLSEFEYDSLQRISATHIWNVIRKYDQHFLTFYDSLGRTIKRNWFDRDGIAMGSDSIVYDENSNIVFERFYDFVNQSWNINFYEYQFDKYNNILLKDVWTNVYDRKKLKSRILREYLYE